MSEAKIVMAAQWLIADLEKALREAQRQVKAARSLTETLEAEAHSCPNQAHHRGWWHDNTEDL
jgi:hypothetical protein